MARTAAEVWEIWLEMWNEDPKAALKIVGDDFRVHLPSKAAVFDTSGIRDGAALAEWVAGFRSKFASLRYETDFGPVQDGELAVWRWYGTAECLGRTGWPSDVPGGTIHWSGVDILRIVDGQVTEAWTQGVETDEVPGTPAHREQR
jgi:hypothetical protein